MRREEGFTLVELLVVIVILGVLAGVVVFAVGGSTTKAAASACRSDVKNVEDALEAWRAQNNGSYPSNGTAGQTQLTTGSSALLRSWPHSSQYTIALDATVAGQVMVTLPGGSAINADDPSDPCSSAGTSVAAGTGATGATGATGSTGATGATGGAGGSAVVVSNGVTATPSVNGATSAYYGEVDLALTNPAPMSDLSVTIKVAKTPGVSYHGQYTNFWGGTVNMGNTTGSSTIDYTFVANTSIVAGSWTIAAQYNGTGTPRVTTGDTWTVTSTSGGVTSTLNGTF
jgi:type II secretion system protein G